MHVEKLTKLLLAGLLLFLPAVAQADWKEASTRHFIIYSEGSEESLRDAATKLEKYDFLLRWASKVTKPSQTPKLKIYLMRNFEEVQGTLPFAAGGIAGYYNARTRGPVAVGSRTGLAGQVNRTGTRIGNNDLYEFDAQTVLLHEYAHHFMFQYFPAAYPAWYSEGFAEFYGTTKILPNDVIEVGHVAGHRYASFQANDWLPLSKMLTAKNYGDVGGQIDLLYAQGWLLVHYLSTTKERAGQLPKYLAALNAGKDYQKAMDEAFGPGARKLDEELRAYSGRRRLTAVRLPFKPIDVGPIAVRTLSPAEDALMKADIAFGRGVIVSEAPALAKEVRSIAARFPKDPHALSILIEAERAAGNREAAAAAVARWLAVQPGAPRALMHQAELEIDALRQTRSTNKAAWEKPRTLLLDANKRAPGDPMILEAYYDSFLAEGVLPPPGAQNALVKAFDLVPQDDDLRYKLASDFEQRQMIEDAIQIIKPAAFSLSEEENPAKRAKRERQEARYREVDEVKRETPREMLARLETKLAGRAKSAQGAK
jgi:hypothetical protein